MQNSAVFERRGCNVVYRNYSLGNTAQFPPNGSSTAPAAAAPRSPYRHLELCGIAFILFSWIYLLRKILTEIPHNSKCRYGERGAAAAGAVLKPSGGNCAVLPYGSASCGQILLRYSEGTMPVISLKILVKYWGLSNPTIPATSPARYRISRSSCWARHTRSWLT